MTVQNRSEACWRAWFRTEEERDGRPVSEPRRSGLGVMVQRREGARWRARFRAEEERDGSQSFVGNKEE